jgi:hypothetical protein
MLDAAKPDHAGLEEVTLGQHAEIYQAYFDERRLIPAGRLRMRYEDLEADPIGQLRDVQFAADWRLRRCRAGPADVSRFDR